MASSERDATSQSHLEKKLRELPEDLHEFYEVIIERISKPNRHLTFALLELLHRLDDIPTTAAEARDAVLVSGCSDFDEAKALIEKQYVEDTTIPCMRKKVRDEGLVEIKNQNDVDVPVLMHQTVLEFTMGLAFKKIVIGDLAAIISDNGHSFYAKLLMIERNLNATVLGIRSVVLNRFATPEDEKTQQLVHHSQMSELTTGNSQLDFISSIPTSSIRCLAGSKWILFKDPTSLIIAFATSYGLSLCLRDWIAQNPGKLARISAQTPRLPLLSCLIPPVSGSSGEQYLKIVQMLFDNGYQIDRDQAFFGTLIEEVWTAEFAASVLPKAAVHKLVALALQYGQDPETRTALFSASDLGECTVLHIAPPELTAELIRARADVDAEDLEGRTPLQWVIDFPHELLSVRHRNWNKEWRYIKCKLLLEVGARISQATKDEVLVKALEEFDDAGLDVKYLKETFQAQGRIKDLDTWTRPLFKLIQIWR